MLGRGTLLAEFEKERRAARTLALDGNEARLLSLLTAALGRPIAEGVIAKIRRTGELWCAGEKTLAQIHLAFIGLPKIDEADAFVVEANPPHLSSPSSPFDPYDAYDAFEFARDLMGREVSTLELSKLADGRFPDMSDESRRLMIHYLIENGAAEVARKTGSGRPTWYRFRTPGRGGVVDQVSLTSRWRASKRGRTWTVAGVAASTS